MFSFFQRCCRQTKVQFRAFVCPELVVLTAAVVDAPPLILQTFCSLNNAEGARSYCVSALKAHRFPPFVNWRLCFLLLICVTVQWSGNKKRHVVSPTVVHTVLLLWFRFIHSPRFLTKLNPSCESYRGTVFLRSEFYCHFLSLLLSDRSIPGRENTFGTASQSICICIPGALYWFKAIQVYITALFQLYYCNPFPTNCMSCCICTWSLPLNATLTLRWCSTNRGLWQLSVVWCIIVLFLKQA